MIGIIGIYPHPIEWRRQFAGVLKESEQ
jgi:hypothetical protein